MIFRKIAAISIVATLFFMPGTVVAKQSNMDKRIENLEKEIDELKAGQKELDTKVIKTKFPVIFYGFAAAQPFYGTAKVQMYNGLNSTAAPSRVADKTTQGNNNGWFSITPQNSRLGLNWTGSKVGKNTYIGGIFEIDFVNILNSGTYGTSPIPRIRHLSFELWGERWSFLAGQNWDIFSPLNTLSLSLGNNVWYQGNLGFRRPQLRFAYKFIKDDVNTLKLAISADHPANTDNLYTGGVESAMPYGEALLEYKRKMKHGDFIAAISGAAGADRVNGRYAKMFGMAGSLSVPIHKFLNISGEIQYGQNLGSFLTYSGTNADVRDIAGWGQISSKWFKKFETNFGYGVDSLQTSKVAANNVGRNQIFFGNFKVYPVDAFYVGIEYEYMRTYYKGNGSSVSNVIFANFVYSF